MDDLIAFLRSRLDEDDRRARAVAGEDWDDIEWQDLPESAFAHAKNHDPARVLADVEAKREIIDHLAYEYSSPILRWLALPYAGHPDYRDEWATMAPRQEGKDPEP